RGIAANGELNSRIEADGIAQEVDDWVYANVEARVIGVPVLNGTGIREESRTSRVALGDHAGNGWPAIQTHVVPRCSDRFHRGAGRRQGGIGFAQTANSGVQLV